MMELLKKGVKFVWNDKCEEVFQTLKARLTTAPGLTIPDSTKPFDVYCDASGTGLGSVLMQDNLVIVMHQELSGIMRRIIQHMIWS